MLPEFISQRLTEGNGQLLHFHTGKSLGDAEVDVDDSNWAPRTIWVGAIPKAHANKATLVRVFADIGPIQSVNVRVKDSVEAGKNERKKAAEAAAAAAAAAVMGGDGGGAQGSAILRASEAQAEDADVHKSWALISFRSEEHARQAARLGWKKGEDRSRKRARRASVGLGNSIPYVVELVIPEAMQSPQAQYIRTAQEIDVGNRCAGKQASALVFQLIDFP